MQESTQTRKRKKAVVFRRDYDKYLVGRSYVVFKRAIKTERTLEFYRRNLCYFLVHAGMDTEQIVQRYAPYVKAVTGEHRPNIEGQIELQRLVEEYVLALADRVDKDELKPTSVVTLVPCIKLFLSMNDILLNWTKINKLLPRSDLAADDEAYSREDIQKMLNYTDLRGKVIILLLSSSGMRLGGLAELRVGDITPIYDKNDPNNHVLAAHVRVYATSADYAYDTFITLETWGFYQQYLDLRRSWGESITKDSPAIIVRFNKRTLKEKAPKPIHEHTIQDMIITIRKKAGVDVKSKNYNGRYVTKSVHGFRKWFNTTLKSIKTKDGQPAVQFINKERLLGHRLTGALSLENNYDRMDKVKELLSDYLKAVHELTVADDARLALKVSVLENDVATYRTVELEISQKDKEIRELQTKMEAVERASDEKFNHVISLIQQNPRLASIKPEALIGLQVKEKGIG